MTTVPPPRSFGRRCANAAGTHRALIAVVPLAAWSVASGVFILSHDRMLAALLGRQAAMEEAYEERIAVLQDEVGAAGRRATDRERGIAVATPYESSGLRTSIGPVGRGDGGSAASGSEEAVGDGEPQLARTERANARMEAALAALGLAPERSDVGGPLVPLPGSGTADASVARGAAVGAALDAALARQRQLRAVASRLPLRQPVEGPLDVTSGFGARRDPFLGRLALHTGIDLREAYGAAVTAVASGTVTIAGSEAGYGSMVEIDHGNGYATRYAHLSAVTVAVGQTVQAGAPIGRIGTTGRSTGPHLHYEIRIAGEPVDPARYLDLATAMAAP